MFNKKYFSVYFLTFNLLFFLLQSEDPTIALIAHISNSLFALKELTGALTSSGKCPTPIIADTFSDCVTAGLKEFCVSGLGFKVNYEPDKLIGSAFFDAVHTVMGYMPSLPSFQGKDDGKVMLHYKCKTFEKILVQYFNLSLNYLIFLLNSFKYI